ncbi:MAG TPA: DNA polymerase III subunit epsilon [Candidatus Omnitrophica bacterium]|nr:DNA polymerase III subunit epsilon [Candidatus Omnitrophota bacterium]HCI44957.1 DNA polymerase III subunit epsilon [Candidatus Omnitrophota bacterium]
MKLSHALVVLDLETTGIWVERDKIIEIAMVKSFPDNHTETYLKKVNPGVPIPAVISQLIGITDADVKDAPAFKDIAQEVLQFIGDSDLAGFNIEKFDLPLLEREVREANLQFNWRTHKVYDAQRVYHLNEKRDLYAAYKFYCDKDLNNAHSALADAQATLEILEAQVAKYGDGDASVEHLGQYRYRSTEEFYDKEKKFRWWNGKLYMMFGKYANKYTLQEIVQKDRSYLGWILSAQFSEEVKELVENALNGRFPQPSEK